MRLVVTSDCHGKLANAQLPSGDVLILAGDILANRSGDPDIDAAFQLNEIRELDDYCGALGFKHVLMIAGNHDWVFERHKDARMVSPGGWREPGQTPSFDEYTLVVRGTVRVETRSGVINVTDGQAFFAPAGEWVRYTTPEESGAEYIAICVPAFSPEAVNRDPA